MLLLFLFIYPSPTPGQQPDRKLHNLLKQAAREISSFGDPFDAEVWLTDMSGRMEPFIKNPEQRITLLKKIHQEARRNQLPPELVLAVIQTESAFDRFAVSSAGAQGLMQVMPFWKNEIGHPRDNLTVTETNLRYGCQILGDYLKKEKGNLTRALARYNGSIGQYWYPERVYSNLEKYWTTPQ